MLEIRNRLGLLDGTIEGCLEANSYSIPQVELAGLQLRKCYELIAFSSLSANRERFNKAWRKYEKEWRLDKIVKAIQLKNAQFLPQPVDEVERERTIHLEFLSDSIAPLTAQRLLRSHGELGKLMHATNPYRERIDYQSFLRSIKEQRDYLVNLLSVHISWIVEDQVVYRVAMKGPDGKVNVVVLEAKDL